MLFGGLSRPAKQKWQNGNGHGIRVGRRERGETGQALFSSYLGNGHCLAGWLAGDVTKVVYRRSGFILGLGVAYLAWVQTTLMRMRDKHTTACRWLAAGWLLASLLAGWIARGGVRD